MLLCADMHEDLKGSKHVLSEGGEGELIVALPAVCINSEDGLKQHGICQVHILSRRLQV